MTMLVLPAKELKIVTAAQIILFIVSPCSVCYLQTTTGSENDLWLINPSKLIV